MQKQEGDKRPLVALIDLGCAKNTVDSEAALGELLSGDFDFALELEQADVLLVNTCGFIKSARDESLLHLQEAVNLKQQNPALKVVAIGCLAERWADKLLKKLSGLDGVFGLSAYGSLAGLCKQILGGEQLVSGCGEGGAIPAPEQVRLLLTGDAYAYLKIADGCDNCCSYCAVPLIRGGFKSRSEETIIKEAEQLLESGVKELCIIAQDITSFGIDLSGKRDLGKLLKKLLKLPGKPWLRLLYAHPAYLDDEVIDLLAGEKQLLSYLDLPIQHINDSILSAMGRKTTRKGIEEKIFKLRKANPDIVLRSSIICGYPGETEAEFNELLEFVAEGHFQHLGAFAYSREAGTKAAEMGGQVPHSQCLLRRDEVMQRQQPVTFAWLDSRLGQEVDLLIEGGENGNIIARSPAEAPDVDGSILLKKGKFSPGKLIRACLVKRNCYDLVAKTV